MFLFQLKKANCYSTFICTNCDGKLNEIINFQLELIDNQTRLNTFVAKTVQNDAALVRVECFDDESTVFVSSQIIKINDETLLDASSNRQENEEDVEEEQFTIITSTEEISSISNILVEQQQTNVTATPEDNLQITTKPTATETSKNVRNFRVFC